MEEDKTERYVDKGPRSVEQRDHAGSGDRLPEDVEVSHRLLGAWPQARVESGGENVAGELPVQADAGAHQQPSANQLQQGKRGQTRDEKQRQEQERGHAPHRHDTVVHLQHVDSRGDIQKVDCGAESGGEEEVPPARANRRFQGCRAQTSHGVPSLREGDFAMRRIWRLCGAAPKPRQSGRTSC